ncbi:MAG TPA: SH3 domain-containing protein [Myxococcaceae bacterium]|nr:SH3 domain-containing protein [Myxococcaceae bacterium]
MRLRKRETLLVLALALGAPGSASAVEVGGTLYVRAKDTRLLESPSPTSKVLAILQPAQSVVWQGAHPRNKRWHHVKAGGRSGYVFQSNLATKPPSMELVAGEGSGKLDAQAFASSGAAVKAVSSGVLSMGNQRLELKESILQLDALEHFVQERVKDEDVAAHAQQAGLAPAAPTTAAPERKKRKRTGARR